MLVDFTAEELQDLNEWAQFFHVVAKHERQITNTNLIAPDGAVLSKALDALARYREAERAAVAPSEPVRSGALR